MNGRGRGTFPSQPVINPLNQRSNQVHIVQEEETPSQVNAITTLMSGKQFDNSVALPKDSDPPITSILPPTHSAQNNPNEDQVINDPIIRPSIPFPHRLKPKNHSPQMEKVLETF